MLHLSKSFFFEHPDTSTRPCSLSCFAALTAHKNGSQAAIAYMITCTYGCDLPAAKHITYVYGNQALHFAKCNELSWAHSGMLTMMSTTMAMCQMPVSCKRCMCSISSSCSDMELWIAALNRTIQCEAFGCKHKIICGYTKRSKDVFGKAGGVWVGFLHVSLLPANGTCISRLEESIVLR